MKSIIKENNKTDGANDTNYPRLMSGDTGSLVLFEKKECGTVVGRFTGCSNNLQVGYYSDYWVMSRFKPFTGKVTLKS